MTKLRIEGRSRAGKRIVQPVLLELPIRRLFDNLNSGTFVLAVQHTSDGALEQVRFVGAGWADNSGSDLFSSSTIVSQGVGFRYNIARMYGMHVGLDVARGPEDTVWYIQVGSAW